MKFINLAVLPDGRIMSRSLNENPLYVGSRPVEIFRIVVGDAIPFPSDKFYCNPLILNETPSIEVPKSCTEVLGSSFSSIVPNFTGDLKAKLNRLTEHISATPTPGYVVDEVESQYDSQRISDEKFFIESKFRLNSRKIKVFEGDSLISFLAVSAPN